MTNTFLSSTHASIGWCGPRSQEAGMEYSVTNIPRCFACAIEFEEEPTVGELQPKKKVTSMNAVAEICLTLSSR